MLLVLRVSRVLNLGGGGGGLWEVRVTVILFVNSFSPIGVLAVCVFGIGTSWGPYVRSEIA